MATETVTVTCWKCHGSGRYALGVCYGCDGAGTNTYNAAAWARKEAAAVREAARVNGRNAAAAAAKDAELAAMSDAELETWVRDVACIGHDGLLDDWVPGSDTETERVTVAEKVRRLRSEVGRSSDV